MAAASFKVKAVYDYASSHEDDLPFGVGQIITVTDTEDPEWYGGEYIDDSGEKQEGIFPRNFVEKFEPAAPPRPTRPRKKDPEPAPAPPSPSPPPAAEPAATDEGVDIVPRDETHEDEAIAESRPPPAEEPRPVPAPPSIPVANPPDVAPVLAPAPIEPEETHDPAPATTTSPPLPKPASQSRSGPPPVTQKPTSNSFKDRIAAFNKPAAPPVAPFKPGGLGSGSGSGSGFIKKPFVAPPPSRNAFVPQPRDVPTAKVYRREEDPEIKETEAESRENAEKAGLVPGADPEVQGEDQPKPTTLKERIALLQKQQAEAAQRHADATAKKEKPKRPPKKRTETEEALETPALEEPVAAPPPLERKDTNETSSKKSMDEPRSTRQSLSIRRRSTGIVENSGNEADMSGAGDTTEGQEDLTERDDSDERPKPPSRAPTGPVPEKQHPQAEDVGEEEDEEDEEEDEDPEVRRKAELRARMAKMSGGMGMAGMFGPPGVMSMGGPASKKPKPPAAPERRSSEQAEAPASPRMTAPPIPTMMALPGMSTGKPKQPEPELSESEGEEDVAEEAMTPVPTNAEHPDSRPAPPPVTEGRPAPPPIPAETRPPPPPPPAAVASPSIGSESDDELSENPPLETPRGETGPSSRAPPPLPMASPPFPTSPRLSGDKFSSYMGGDMSSSSMSPQQSKRNSRPPPPIPGAAPLPPTQTRPPPPPPPSGGLSRTNTTEVTPMQPGPLDNGEEGEVTEYEGDYDTDIASSAPHKDALKSHARDSSFDDSTSVHSPISGIPSSAPPPIPGSTAPRGGPPPIPSQPAPTSRVSIDSPRIAPPPVPGMSSRTSIDGPRAPPPPVPQLPTSSRPSMDASRPALASRSSRASVDAPRGAPPPPPPMKSPSYADDEYDPFSYNAPQYHKPPSMPPSRSVTVHEELDETPVPIEPSRHEAPRLPRQSMDRQPAPAAPPPAPAATRQSVDMLGPASRGSHDPGRASVDTGFAAHDLGMLKLTQPQLESAYELFGRWLASEVAKKKDTTVGDGKPLSLIHELLHRKKDNVSGQRDVHLPIGPHSYGALVRAIIKKPRIDRDEDIDVIRPGDIISFRNAFFEGKHGKIKKHYTMDVGQPDHVGIVAEWELKKNSLGKIRAWEQGRESKKVTLGSYRLDDFKSGEVMVWRVMFKDWEKQPQSIGG